MAGVPDDKKELVDAIVSAIHNLAKSRLNRDISLASNAVSLLSPMGDDALVYIYCEVDTRFSTTVAVGVNADLLEYNMRQSDIFEEVFDEFQSDDELTASEREIEEVIPMEIEHIVLDESRLNELAEALGVNSK